VSAVSPWQQTPLSVLSAVSVARYGAHTHTHTHTHTHSSRISNGQVPQEIKDEINEP